MAEVRNISYSKRTTKTRNVTSGSMSVKYLEKQQDVQKNAQLKLSNIGQVTIGNDTFSVANGRLGLNDNYTAIEFGYKNDADRKSYRQNNPELYSAMNGVKYISPTDTSASSRAKELSAAAESKVCDRFNNVDSHELQGIIDMLNTGEWQDSDTMKKYSDAVNTYANDYIALNELGYFNHLPENERKGYIDTLKNLKEMVNNSKTAFADYKDAYSYKTDNIHYLSADEIVDYINDTNEKINMIKDEKNHQGKDKLEYKYNAETQKGKKKVILVKKELSKLEENKKIANEALKSAFNKKYDFMTWEELDDAERKIRDKLSLKTNTAEYDLSALQKLIHIEGLKSGWDKDRYNYFIEFKTASDSEKLEMMRNVNNDYNTYFDNVKLKNNIIDGIENSANGDNPDYVAFCEQTGYINAKERYIEKILSSQNSEKDILYNLNRSISFYENKYGSVENLILLHEKMSQFWYQSEDNKQNLEHYEIIKNDSEASENIEAGKKQYSKKDKLISDSEYEIACYYLGKGQSWDIGYLAWLKDRIAEREVASSKGWSTVNNSDLINKHQLWAEYAKENPVTADLASVGLNLASGMEWGYNTLSGNIGAESKFATAATTIRQTRTNQVDWEIGNWDAFDFLYNTGMSMVDSVAATTLLGNVGGVALGLSAAAQGTNDALNRGMSNEQAFLNGLASGVFEGVFESLSFGSFKDLTSNLKITDVIDITKYIGKNMWNNAKEEMFTEIANILYDTLINGGYSNYRRSFENYIKSGMNEKEAKSKAIRELALQVVEAASSGALMGLGFGSVSGVVNYFNGNGSTENLKPDIKVKYDGAANSKILNLIEKVKNGAYKANDKEFLHNPTNQVVKKITEITGIDVSDFKVAIEARQVAHIIKDHGENGATDHSMSNDFDIAKMEYALDRPDSIVPAGITKAYVTLVYGKNKPAKTVLYEKSLGNDSYYVVQAVPDTKAKTLYIVSAFIGKKGYKKETLQTTDANSPSATPNSENASVSLNNRISQSRKTVNDKYWRQRSSFEENNMQAMIDAVYGDSLKVKDAGLRSSADGVVDSGSEAEVGSVQNSSDTAASGVVKGADGGKSRQKSNATNYKLNNISKTDYDKFFFKKPIKASKKDWAKVNSARTQKYSQYAEEDIPDIDFFRIAEYNEINIAYRYYVRNYDKYSFEIVSKIKIKEEHNDVKTTYTNVNADGLRRGVDIGSSGFAEYGQAISSDDKLVELSEKSDEGRTVNNGDSNSGRRIDNSNIREATSQTQVAFSMLENQTENYKLNNNSQKDYDKFFFKKPIKVSKKDWSKVDSARIQKYLQYAEEDIPDIDFFRIAEYNQINIAYKYVVRNYDKYNFEIVSKIKIKPEASQMSLEEKYYDETAYTKDDSTRVRRGSDRNDSFSFGYGQAIRSDDTMVGRGDESDEGRSANKDISDSGRRIDNSNIREATSQTQVASFDFLEKRTNGIDADEFIKGMRGEDNDSEVLTQYSTNAVTNPLSSYAPAKRGMIIDFLKSVDERLKVFVERVKNGSNKFERFSISDVSGREAADIKDLLGIDIDGYTHNINTSGIKHILKRHGISGNHDKTMSNDNDIARMGWVIKNYDNIELLTKEGEIGTSVGFKDKSGKPAPQIRYSKKINGTYYVVEAVFENDYNKLWVQSAYLKNEKEGVTQVPAESENTNRAAYARSEFASPPSNNNISQSEKAVNDKYWEQKSDFEKDNMQAIIDDVYGDSLKFADNSNVLNISKNDTNSQLQSNENNNIINSVGDIYVDEEANRENVRGIREKYFQKIGDDFQGGISESAETFAERARRNSLEGSRQERLLLNEGKLIIAYTPVKDNNSQKHIFFKKLREYGIDIYYCDGVIETNVDGVTMVHNQAITTRGGKIFVSSVATVEFKSMMDHELVHWKMRTFSDSYFEYEDIILRNLNRESNYYIAFCEELNLREYNNRYDINTIEGAIAFNSEITAYVYQYVLNDSGFAENFFSKMFFDWHNVKNAVKRFNSKMEINTELLNQVGSNDESAFFTYKNGTENNTTEHGKVMHSSACGVVDSVKDFNYNDNSINKGENYDGENTELLERGTVSAVNRGNNVLWQPGTNSETLAACLGMSQGSDATHIRTIRAGECGWLVERKNSASKETWKNFDSSVFGRIRGVKLSGKDTIGGTVSTKILEKFKNTICKDERGNLISLYHWTTEKFETFNKGEFGFHFGTLRAAHDRYLQVNEDNPDISRGIYKEVILNIKNPIEINDEMGEWCANWVAFQLLQKGIIEEKEYDNLSKLAGFEDNTYDNPAAEAVRNILAKNGYDGIIYKNLSEDAGSYSLIALHPEQIVTVAENGVLKENSGVSRAISGDEVAFLNSEEKQTNGIDADEFVKGLRGEDSNSAAEQGEGLHSSAGGVVDSVKDLNYNDNSIKEGEMYAEDYQRTMGAFGREIREDDAGGTSENAEITREDKISFERRIKRTYKNSGRLFIHLNVIIACKEPKIINKNLPAGVAYNILKSKGYNVVYCDGPILINNNKYTVERTEAVTIFDGTIYISSDSTLNGEGIALHEVVHVWQYANLEKYLNYKDVLCEELILASEKYKEIAKGINDNHYNGRYDIEDINSFEYIMRELTAYISQYVCTNPKFAREKFGGMFDNWDNVVKAVYELNNNLGFGDIIKEATLQTQVASLNLGEKQTNGIDADEFVKGLRGEDSNSAAEQGEGLQSTADGIVDSVNDFNYNDNSIKEGESYGKEQLRNGGTGGQLAGTNPQSGIGGLQKANGPVFGTGQENLKGSQGIPTVRDQGNNRGTVNERKEQLRNGGTGGQLTGTNPQSGVGSVQETSGGIYRDNRESGTEPNTIYNQGNNRGIELSQEQVAGLKSTAIKNEDGTPKKVYHFTNNMDFEVFAKGDIGFHFGNESQARQRGKNLKQQGRIITAFLDIKNPIYINTDLMSWRPAHVAIKLYADWIITYEQYLLIRELHIENGYEYNSPAAVSLRKILADLGYDGIIYENHYEGDGKSYIAFYPEQIIIIDDGKTHTNRAISENEVAFLNLNEKQIDADKFIQGMRGEDGNSAIEQGEVLQSGAGNIVDIDKDFNYNDNNIKEGEMYAEDYQRTMGSFGREIREDDTRARS